MSAVSRDHRCGHNVPIADCDAFICDARSALERACAIEASAAFLVEELRDKWACPSAGASTVFLQCFVFAMVKEWRENPPPNGVTLSVQFPDSVMMDIEIRRSEGKGAAAVIAELQAENKDLLAALCDMQTVPDCWCLTGAGNPHSPACLAAANLVAQIMSAK